MRFLHAADVHLGGANAQERMMVFENMLSFCSRQGIPLLLIAGDLFEAPRAEESVRRKAFRAMEMHPDVSILIAAGNHDPNCAGGNYDGALPGNVYVFGSRWSCVRIAELNVRVWGASFDAQTEPRFILPERTVQTGDGCAELGVLHADLVSENAESSYRALSQGAVADTGLDYLALGHVHQRSRLMRAGQTYYAYSGCLQGAGFDETGEKGAYLGEIDENGLKLSFVRLCGSVWREKTLDVSGLEDALFIAQAAQKLTGDARDHVRIVLTGEVSEPVDVQAVERLLRGKAVDVRVEDETTTADYASLARENTLRGAFVRRMLKRIENSEGSGAEAAAERLALRYGLAAFEGEVKTHAHRADTDR